MERKIAKFLKNKRKEVGLTQKEFALKTGVGLNFLRDIEQERNNLTLDNLNQLLSMFGGALGVVTESELDSHEG